MTRILMLLNTTASDPVHDAGGRRRVDFRMVRDELDARCIDLEVVRSSVLGRTVRRCAGNYVALAVLGFLEVLRGRVDAVLCDNENEALVLAVLLKAVRRRTPLTTLAIYPSARKKSVFFALCRVQTHVDLWLTYNSLSADRLVVRSGVPPERVRILPYYADESFFDPAAADVRPTLPEDRPYVLAVGRQHRDYPLLLEAAPRIPADIVIAASSLYSKSADRLAGAALPEGVRVVNLDYEALRSALAGAAAVVIPTVEAEFGPGITALLEAMAMARPVVYTRAEGSIDYLADRRAVLRGAVPPRPTGGLLGALGSGGQGRPGPSPARGPHGFYVPVGDRDALVSAVTWLLQHPDDAAEMGRRGRLAVEESFTLGRYVDGVTSGVRAVLSSAAPDTEVPARQRGVS